jgi:peptidoglycan/LPS O-acetylase OafA/YrhL
MTERNSTIYFANLDIVRALAAYMVVFAHGYEAWTGWCGHPKATLIQGTTELNWFGEIIQNFFLNLSVGVDVFFLISGFLITYLLLTEKSRTGKVHFKNFFIRRGLRIWPLYYFLILITPFWVQFVQAPHPDYVWNIVFLNNFHAIQTGEWQFPFAHFWSICVEEHFYLIWPFAVALIPTKRLLLFFTTVIVLSIGYRFYVFRAEEHPQLWLYLHTLSRMDILALGSLAAWWHHTKGIRIDSGYFFRIAAFAAFVSLLLFDRYANWNTPATALFKKYAYAIPAGYLILDYLFNSRTWFRFVRKTPLHYLGKISYGVYMYHNFLINFVMNKIIYDTSDSWNGPLFSWAKWNMYAFIVIYLGLTTLLAILSYELFEKRLLTLKDKFAVIKTKR